MNKRLAFLLVLLLLVACRGPATPPSSTTGAPPTATAAAVVPPTRTPTVVPASLQPVTPFRLLRIAFSSEQEGWALDEAYLLRTEDGGRSWLDASPPGDLAPGPQAEAFFLDAQHAWLLTAAQGDEAASLFRTADGGQTWQVFVPPFARAWLQFLDADTGFALADLGVGAGSMAVALYKTADGGQTWEQVFTNDPNLPEARTDLPLNGIKQGMYFKSPHIGWIVGLTYANGQSYLYKTEDGGQSWVEQPLTLPSAFDNAFVLTEPPYFFNDQDGLMSVGLSSEVAAQVIFSTRDGGQTWKTGFPLNVSARAIFLPPQTVYLWDGGNRMYISQDGGESWASQQVALDFTGTLLDASFVNAQIGWALLDDEDGQTYLYQTMDGGATWQRLQP